MASATLGRWPLLGGSRFAHGAIPRPSGADSEALARVVGDYLFGLDDQPAAAELATSRVPDGDFRWVLNWRTDVMVARDGTEQRVATLTNPRQRFEGSFLLDDTDTRTVRQLLSTGPAGTYELPLAHEAVATTVEITGGTIYVDHTCCDWITAGRRVYVRGPGGDAYTTTITGSSGGTINVSSSPPVGGRFPAGLTLIYPVEEIRFENAPQLARYPVNASRWSFRGRAVARAQLGTGAPAAVTFDGHRVLDRRPYQEKTVDEVIDGGVEFVDNGATMTSSTSWSRAKHRRHGFWRIDSPADRQWWKAFLAERRGKLEPFLFPTWEPDLALYEQPTAGASFVRVTDDYLGDWYPSLAHRRLQIEYADRSVTHHWIHSTSQASGYQELTLVPTLANPFPTGGVTRVSFLETARLDTDEVAIEYGSGWKAKVSPPTVIVQESETRTFAWPQTAAALRSALGFGTWNAAWDFSEQLGAFAALFGGVTLTPAGSPGTPTYRNAGPLAGDYAVGFDAGEEDRIQTGNTNTYDLDSATSLAGYLCFRATTAANRFFLGKISTNYYGVLFDSTPGHVQLAIDGAAGAASTTIAVAHHDSAWHDLIWCIDRVNQRIQLFTDLGTSTAVDISGVTTLTSGAFFFLGSAPFSNIFDLRIAYAAICTGGIDSLRANGAAAIANMRRFTGRV